MSNNKMWAEKVYAYAHKQEPSEHKAQAYNIANKLSYTKDTIAQMMFNDHNCISAAMRHSELVLVECGLAKHVQNEHEQAQHLYGYIEYVDGSVLNQWGVMK